MLKWEIWRRHSLEFGVIGVRREFEILPIPGVFQRFQYDNHLVSIPRFAETLMGGLE